MTRAFQNVLHLLCVRALANIFQSKTLKRTVTNNAENFLLKRIFYEIMTFSFITDNTVKRKEIGVGRTGKNVAFSSFFLNYGFRIIHQKKVKRKNK